MSVDLTTPGYALKARPTTYKGTKMRSRLEAQFAEWLDRQDVSFEYEPMCFGAEEGQYLPDFRIDDVEILGSPRTLYVEVKPRIEFVTNKVLARMSIIWKSDPDAFLVSEAPGTNPMVLFPPALNCRPMVMQWVRSNNGGIGLARPLQRWGAA